MKRLLCIFLCMGLCLFGCNTKVVDPETFNKDNSIELPKAEKRRPQGIEEIFSAFSKICESNGFSRTPSQKEAKEVSKKIYISDKKTVYDEGEYYRYTSPNGEGVSFGTEKTSVSYSSSYKDGQIINAASIRIGSKTKGFSFPFGIQIQDSQTEIFDMLGVLEKFMKKRDGSTIIDIYRDSAQWLYFYIDRTSPTVSLCFTSNLSEGTDLKYTHNVFLTFKDNALKEISCSSYKKQNSEKTIFDDNRKIAHTVFPSQRYIRARDVYIKINSVTVTKENILVKFSGYSEKRNSEIWAGISLRLSDDVLGGSAVKKFFNFGRTQEYAAEISLDSVIEYQKLTTNIVEGCYFKVNFSVNNLGYLFNVSGGSANNLETYIYHEGATGHEAVF